MKKRVTMKKAVLCATALALMASAVVGVVGEKSAKANNDNLPAVVSDLKTQEEVIAEFDKTLKPVQDLIIQEEKEQEQATYVARFKLQADDILLEEDQLEGKPHAIDMMLNYKEKYNKLTVADIVAKNLPYSAIFSGYTKLLGQQDMLVNNSELDTYKKLIELMDKDSVLEVEHDEDFIWIEPTDALSVLNTYYSQEFNCVLSGHHENNPEDTINFNRAVFNGIRSGLYYTTVDNFSGFCPVIGTYQVKLADGNLKMYLIVPDDSAPGKIAYVDIESSKFKYTRFQTFSAKPCNQK